ncbi:MAG: LacI family DNA-binding transcriptional regulator [Verrucomicrobia bacterium]|nr:LacI family DNA-binding transcriptional regulator [Verrucomicrobiota bacterium]
MVATASKITLKDVAQASGLAVSTVSNILCNSPHSWASTATRQRVFDVAKKTGYRVNLVARGLSLGRTFNIGFYINRVEYLALSRLSWHRTVLAMQTRLWKHGYRLGFYVFEPGQDLGFEEFLTPHRYVDGIIVQGRNLSAEEIAAIRESKIRTVSMFENIRGFHSLAVDEFRAGRVAAEYLYQRGHRQAAIIAGLHHVERWDGRIRGFVQRSAEIGLEVPESAQHFVDAAKWVHSERVIGRKLFRQFLRSEPSIRCLYVPSDYYAFGVVDELDEQGLRLGADFSLLSYDNLEGAGHAPWGAPRLTTFEPPSAEIGGKAADLIVAQSESSKPTQTIFTPELVERSSVANGPSATSDQ